MMGLQVGVLRDRIPRLEGHGAGLLDVNNSTHCGPFLVIDSITAPDM